MSASASGAALSGAAADNVVILSGEDKEPAGDGKFTGADMAKRFDAIRDATDRAERTAQAVRNTMSDEARENYAALYGALWGEWQAHVKKARPKANSVPSDAPVAGEG